MPGLTEVSVSASAARPAAAGPFVLIIFGASGDLAHRKLIPAVYELFCAGLWPEEALVVGYARSDKSDDAFRNGLRETLNELRPTPVAQDRWERFASRTIYHRGRYDSEEDFARLRQRLAGMTAEAGIPQNYLFYLATPPEQFPVVAEQLGRAGLARRSGGGGDEAAWSRIVTEKPFGNDLASARQLNRALRHAFKEEQIYRIDHYLGKETVQNLLVLRFANSIFEPLWNYKYIDHVQITVAESLGVAGRGRYYDASGALRDMVQNHMMNLLCLVAMEPPTSLSADAVRNEKVKVLEALRPIPANCAAFGVVRAQYAAGEFAGDPTAGYLDEPGVPADSLTETYAALKLNVDNWRWAGVPFYLRTGKRLARRVTQIAIQFKAVPQVLFNHPPYGPMQPNILVVRIQPDEGISLQFQVKQPGPTTRIHPYTMEFGYADAFGGGAGDAYQRLLLDAAVGDSTLFMRSDEIDAAWRFVTPVLQGCDLRGGRRLATYTPGSWGPAEADTLIAAEGHRWHVAAPRLAPDPTRQRPQGER